MNKKYVLNIGTRILHISGYCHYCIVNKDNSNYKLFHLRMKLLLFQSDRFVYAKHVPKNATKNCNH